jgi:hypothetical protein
MLESEITGNYLKSHYFNLAWKHAPGGYKITTCAQYIIAKTWYEVAYLITELQKKSNTETNWNQGGDSICLALYATIVHP